MSWNFKKIEKIIKNDGVGVLPTDTLYGIVGSAFSKKSVERIYKLKKRNPKKPLIVLVGSISEVGLFGAKIGREVEKEIKKLWPGKVSIIFDCPADKFYYLHRGENKLAFRLPKKKSLLKLIKKTGPLVAPSANPEGLEPATSIREVREYFGDSVDFYVSGGRIKSLPSTIIALEGGRMVIKREGAVEIAGIANRPRPKAV